MVNDPQNLDLVLDEKNYLIYQGDSPLLTRGGRTVMHSEQRLMKHIITDFQLYATSVHPGITSYQLLEFHRLFC